MPYFVPVHRPKTKKAAPAFSASAACLIFIVWQYRTQTAKPVFVAPEPASDICPSINNVIIYISYTAMLLKWFFSAFPRLPGFSLVTNIECDNTNIEC